MSSSAAWNCSRKPTRSGPSRCRPELPDMYAEGRQGEGSSPAEARPAAILRTRLPGLPHHEATTKAGQGKPVYQPAFETRRHFGPNLSRIAAKLGNGEKDSARRWLVQWIMNPTSYHPRTSMPIHLHLAGATTSRTPTISPVWLLEPEGRLARTTTRRSRKRNSDQTQDANLEGPGPGLPGPRRIRPARPRTCSKDKGFSSRAQ